MTHKVFLPYHKNKDNMPFHWLCWSRSEKTLKGNFTFTPIDGGSQLFFTEEEDMQLFILMWGEFL